MSVTTVRDLGARVRSARTARQMTQADLAEALNVSRDWVVRLEKGHPRLEAQKVLDALVVLGLTLEVRSTKPSSSAPETGRYVTRGNNGRVTVKSGSGSRTPKNTKTKEQQLRKGPDKDSETSLTGSVQGAAPQASSAGEPDDPFDVLFGRQP